VQFFLTEGISGSVGKGTDGTALSCPILHSFRFRTQTQFIARSDS